MTDISQKLVNLADKEYTKAFGVRVYDRYVRVRFFTLSRLTDISLDSSAVAFVWTILKTEIHADNFGDRKTIGDFWVAVSSKSSFVKPAEKKACRLDWTILMKYNPMEEDDNSFKLPVSLLCPSTVV
jgi:hypothetical protein